MATSVEGRVPFLDHKHVEFALKIPSSLKYRNGKTKYILKKVAEKFLPYDVVHRKKMGFAAPTSRWFVNNGLFKPYFKKMIKQKNEFWNKYFDTNYIDTLLEKNDPTKLDHSLYLWVIQNIMAMM